MQFSDAQTLGIVEEGYVLPVLNATFVMNIINATDTVCPNGTLTTHSCDGTMNGVVSIQCPEKITESLNKEFKAYKWKEPEFILVEASDGKQIPARIYRPELNKSNGW